MASRLALALFVLAACGEVGGAPGRTRISRDAIIGGVTEPAHPYVVMVGDATDGFCSGTVISKRTVITAGHCWGPPTDYPITAIYFDTGNPVQRTAVAVTQSIRHPQFDANTLTHDLTMVQLAEDAPVQPATLLRETIDASFIGPDFTWVGYGFNDSMMNGFGTRRVARFPINLIGPVLDIPLSGNAPPTATTSIDETQFYFHRPDKNTCNGDSGGPAFVVRGGLERHAGVTSFGDQNCVYDGVDQRTDATAMGWIDQLVSQFEPGNACKSDGTCNTSCVSTSPAPLGTLGDPDCADQHCGADGVCVLGCQIVDADCATLNVNHCANDGICQPGCTPSDADCAGVMFPVDAGSGGGGQDTGVVDAGAAGGGDGGGGQTATGGGDESAGGGTVESSAGGGSAVHPHPSEPIDRDVVGMCGCAQSNALLAPLVLLMLLRLTPSRARAVSSTRPSRRSRRLPGAD